MTGTLKKEKEQEQLKSVEKALHILGTFTMERPQMSIGDLVEQLGIPKVSIYRFLRVLMRHGFIAQNPETHAYRLGIRMFELGSIVLRNFELRKVAFPLIAELSSNSGETVHLGVLDQDRVISIEGVESGQSLRISLPVGKRVYLHSTGIGKAILGFLPDAERQKILAAAGLPRFTPHTITEPERMEREVATIRRRGYAVDYEENEVGVRCVAAPIFDAYGRVIASLSLSGPAMRIGPNAVPFLARMVIDTTRKISEAVGYKI